MLFAILLACRISRSGKRLADDRPDLFEQVVAGTVDPAEALKRKGKNVEIDRATRAKELNAQPVQRDDATLENHIHCCDAVEGLKRIPDGAASLVLFSPPYHGVPVEYDPPLPERTYAQYLEELRNVLMESFRISRRGGRLAIVLDTVRNREGDRHFMLPVVADVTRLAIDGGWGFLNELVWCKGEISGDKTDFGSLGLCSAPGFGRNHETIMLFFKETHKLDGDTTLCDLSREEHLAWRPTEWRIKPEVNKDIRLQHPAPFPEEIPHRMIKMLTYGRDLVIDPYNGSATTTAVATRLGRRYIGMDRSQTYCEFARARLRRL